MKPAVLTLCLALSALALAGCVTPPPAGIVPERVEVVPSCDCDAPETDEGTIARTGFPLGVVWSEHADFREGGQVLRTVQFELAKATFAQIGSAPEKICGFRGETLLSSQVRDPGPEDRDLPGTVVLEALCQA